MGERILDQGNPLRWMIMTLLFSPVCHLIKVKTCVLLPGIAQIVLCMGAFVSGCKGKRKIYASSGWWGRRRDGVWYPTWPHGLWQVGWEASPLRAQWVQFNRNVWQRTGDGVTVLPWPGPQHYPWPTTEGDGPVGIDMEVIFGDGSIRFLWVALEIEDSDQGTRERAIDRKYNRS